MTAADRRTPTAEEIAVWRTFLVTHAAVVRLLEEGLVHGADLPLHVYDVLVQLAEAPERQLRMADLAERVLLSRSGLTRLVDRMERDGLVRRQSCPQDGRGTYTVLTEGGLDRLRQAAPLHLAQVQRHFLGALSAPDLRELQRILGLVLASVGESARSDGAARG